MKIILVYGPPGSGKSINSEAIAAALGCDAIADDMGKLSRFPEKADCLLLLAHSETIRDPRCLSRNLKPDRTLSVAEVRALLGPKWIDAPLPADRPKPVTTFAAQLYEAYCREVGGKAFNGAPLPSWAEFAADPTKNKQRLAWIAVALEAERKLLSGGGGQIAAAEKGLRT